MLLTPVFKGHHDEADSFRDGQHEREDPDGDDLDGSDQGNPDPLNTTPGGDGSVPGIKWGDGVRLLGNFKLFQFYKIINAVELLPLASDQALAFQGLSVSSGVKNG